MAQSVVLRGADVKLYLGGKLYNEVQNVSYTIDYGEVEIFGIDCEFAQEIAPTKVVVSGNVSGVRVKYSGGLQGHEARSRINQILYAPYISFRLKDRDSDVDLLSISEIKITSETMNIPSKGVAVLSFSFKGIIPLNEVDIFG